MESRPSYSCSARKVNTVDDSLSKKSNYAVKTSMQPILLADSDSDDEYLDADEWFKWFKTTDEYKQMNEVSEVTVLTGSNR